MLDVHEDLASKIKFYLRLNRFEAAEKLLRSKLGERADAYVHMLLGVVFHQQSRFDEAITEFNKALKLDPGLLEARMHLVVTMCDLGRYDEARQYYSANDLKPEAYGEQIAKQHYKNGQNYELQNLYIEAQAEFRKACVIAGGSYYQAEVAIAKLLYRNKQIEFALQEFEKLAKKYSNQANIRIWLGICYKKLGRKDEAVIQWEKARALENDPKLSDAFWDLAKEVDRKKL